jgi:uncharacterized protein (TIGR02246 family)
MQNDEQEIRQLVSTWMTASKAGDVEKVLSLMADDVVFLVTGQPPMRKADFAAAARAQAGADAPQFDGSSEIQEIKILGDWAYVVEVNGCSHFTRRTNRFKVTVSSDYKENIWKILLHIMMIALSTSFISDVFQ